MRVRLLVLSCVALLTAAAGARAAPSHLPGISNGHGGFLTQMEYVRQLVPKDDPKAPPVGDQMTPELLRYLVGRLDKIDPSDGCFVLKSVAEMKFAEARGPLLDFVAKNGMRTAYIDDAFRAIGKPDDAVVLAKAIAQPRRDGADTVTEKTIEILIGDDAALWRQVGAVDDPFLKALAARHLVALPPDAATDFVAQFRAGSPRVRRDMIHAIEKNRSPDTLPLLLAAVQDSDYYVSPPAMELLKRRQISDSDRLDALKQAERMFASGIMRLRLTAAHMAAILRDPRGFDWALECGQDFNDSGQMKMGYYGTPLAGVPGEVGKVFEEFDRPDFSNFLRLARKGQRAAALRDVATTLGPRDDPARGVVSPVGPQTPDGQALRRGMEEIDSDLARQLAATIFPADAELRNLPAEDRPLAAAQAPQDADFDIEISRRPFDAPGVLEFRLVKATPGKVVCQGLDFSATVVESAAPNHGHRFFFGGARSESSGLAVYGQGQTVCTAKADHDLAPPGVEDVTLSFRLKLPGGRSLTVERTFLPRQVRGDPAKDVDEYIRRINAADPQESDRALDLFSARGNATYKPVGLTDEARAAVRAAVMKKLQAMAFADAPEDYDSLYYPSVHSASVRGLYRCQNALESLGPETIDEAWFLSLFDAKSYLATYWAYEQLKARALQARDWPAVEKRLLERCQDRLASDNPYAVRNALLLLADPHALLRRAFDDVGDAPAKLAKHPSPMVRAAAASFVAFGAGSLSPDVLFTLADDADLTVSRTAIMGLTAYVDPIIPAKHPADAKRVVALYERLLAGPDKDRARAVENAVLGTRNSDFLPLVYEVDRRRPAPRGEEKEARLFIKLDEAATKFLLGRLAADPSDRVAAGLLVSGGYAWPENSRVGRLQKLLNDSFGDSKPMDLFLQGVMARLAAADPDDKAAAAAFAEALKLHLLRGDHERTGQDCLALAALGVKTDAPLEKVLVAYGPREATVAAVLAINVTDPAAARATLKRVLEDADSQDRPAAVLLANHMPWPELRALASEP